MARRSRGADASDAFELFLDTISNTFGGVLFIALLVCILLNMSGAASESPDPQEDRIKAAHLESKLRGLLERIAHLKEEHEEQKEKIESLLGSQADKGLLVEFSKLSAAEQNELAELARKTDDVRRLNNEVVSLRQLLQLLRQQQAKIDRELRLAGAELQNRTPQQAQRIRLPRFKETNKDQVAIFLSGGRMFMAFHYNGRGKRLSLNKSGVELDAGGKSVRPKPGAGWLIKDREALAKHLKVFLAQFREKSHYFALVVWPDSHAECDMLRDELIRMGFGYNLLLIKEGSPVYIGGATGGTQ